ncbi:hypothetical protein [Adlercreutzia sp. ZJ154]|uniref:hypothetical protein n=1 Tax=Adlercreutzia sp. ZJ154 TaxID=2709790 RepID=UPI0013EB20BA|nr:hypothetical protein [Adlercreutzia sp. ZJ154]
MYFKKVPCDIVLMDYFKSVDLMRDNVESLGLFRKAVLIPGKKDYDSYFSAKRMTRLTFKFLYLHHASEYLEMHGINVVDYSRVFCSYDDPIAYALAKAGKPNPPTFVHFEDGSASYIRSRFTHPGRFERLMGVPERCFTDESYLREPRLRAASAASHEICDADTMARVGCMLPRIYGLYNTRSLSCRTQAMVIDGLESEEFLRLVLSGAVRAFKNSVSVKRHPRRFDGLLSTLGVQEAPDVSMELLCLGGGIADDNILISRLSTSAMLPKLLLGKEPRLVFLYKLVSFEDPNTRDLSDMVERFTSLYSSPDRIACPSSYEEYEEVLERFVRESPAVSPVLTDEGICASRR